MCCLGESDGIHPLPGNILVFRAKGEPTDEQALEFRSLAARYGVTIIIMEHDSTVENLDEAIMKEHGWVRAQ